MGGVVDTGKASRIKNLASLPFPAYEKVYLRGYRRVNFITSRGCPFDCSFCDIPSFWNHCNINRPLDGVLEEIKCAQQKFGFDHFGLVDDNFTIDRERVLRFCDLYSDLDMDAEWSIYGRVNLMDEEMMKKLSEAGCYGIFFGVESGSTRILQKINKGFTREKARRVILEATNYFDKITASFIWGFPFETLLDFKKTVSLIKEFKKNEVLTQLFRLTPFRQTPLFKDYKNRLMLPREIHGSNVPIRAKKIEDNSVIDLVRRYPDLFVPFCRYKTKSFKAKTALLKESGRF